jgi:phosphoribosylaminoimidazolecarboxamide formyltransferase/IMP cyclohydrolase
LVAEFDEPTVAIIKHTNPCGVGSAATLLDAWHLAYETDKQAPFGGIIAVNRPVDVAIAQVIAEIFSEVIVAPEFEPAALTVLQKKKNLRLIKSLQPAPRVLTLRTVTGGLLAQERDTRLVSAAEMKTVTRRDPTQEERHAILFAWRVVKHVKSNAIVFVRADGQSSRTLGIGAGQSRLESQGSRARPPGQRCGQRRLFPVCRWCHRRGRRRGNGGNSAGRQRARCRSDCRRQ